MATATVEVLKEEPDLGKGLSGLARERAQRACVADLGWIEQGAWDPSRSAADPGGYGLLIISGFLVRRVGSGDRFGAELLGPGDLLRPWQAMGVEESLPFEPLWTVIESMQVATLDREFALRAAPFPPVAIQLVDRTMLRSRYLVTAVAIVRQPRVERRLRMILWHYADRWGIAGPDGVTVQLPLTHQLLGDLVAARRPTVSTALGQLSREGKVTREGHRWHLRGGPPSLV